MFLLDNRHFTDALRYMALSEEGWELLKVKKKQKDGVGHDLSVWMKLPEVLISTFLLGWEDGGIFRLLSNFL